MTERVSTTSEGEISHELLDCAQIIWDYQTIYEEPVKSDFILATGHEIRLVDEAIKLFKEGYAEYFIASGGHLYGEMRGFESEDNNKTEAEVFKKRALSKDIPEDKILLQDKSQNIGEVFKYTKKILTDNGINAKKGIFIYEPDKQRRGKASLEKQWPEIDSIVTSFKTTMKDYANNELPLPNLLKQIFGNMKRIIEYPALGFQTKQYIPPDVMEAYNRLLKEGF